MCARSEEGALRASLLSFHYVDSRYHIQVIRLEGDHKGLPVSASFLHLSVVILAGWAFAAGAVQQRIEHVTGSLASTQ